MKKRLFAVLLAVVMIATAINLAPVMEVWATGNIGVNTSTVSSDTKNQYEWDYPEGHWDSYSTANNSGKAHTGSVTYLNDGEYSKLSGGGGTEPVEHTQVRTDPYYRTRHVTMFNDCDAHYNSVMDVANTTPVYQVEYTSGANDKFPTNRGNAGQKVNDATLTTAKKYCSTGQCSTTLCDTCKKKGWSGHTAGNQTEVLPFLVYGYGCTVNHQKGKEYGKTDGSYTRWLQWKDNKHVTFYAPLSGTGGDFRMTFRNYNNTDNTTFNPNGQHFASELDKQGLSIKEYDYLEFDLLIETNSGWTKTRNTATNKTGYYVYLYSETNCAADEYVNGNNDSSDGAKFCIPGWNLSTFSFVDQLRFDNNGNYLDKGKWTTIRLKIPETIKTNPSQSNGSVKQITIRMIGGCTLNTAAISIDNIRFVKNDDHIGKVYTHDSAGNAPSDTYTQYPSGEYFMINDFEFTGDPYESVTKSNHVGITHQNTARLLKVYRQQDTNVDDRFVHMSNSKPDGSWSAVAWISKANNKACVSRKNCGVTQGDYAIAVTLREQECKTVESWNTPAYYQRNYTQPMDLSNFTHFSMDVFIRAHGKADNEANNRGIPALESAQKGVTFAIELYNGSVANDANIAKGSTVRFFLPYYSYATSDAPDQENNVYGTILRLGDNYWSATNASGTNHTASGAMRFTFTRADLLKAATTQGIDLTNVTGMRFIWLNKTDSASSPYFTYRNNKNGAYINHIDIMLDNFIAYTPDTSVTIQNEVEATKEVDTIDNDNQYFLYDIYGGYRSEANDKYINSELGIQPRNGEYDGTHDSITEGIDLTVAVPKNGAVTVKNIPFNSFYISEQRWPWRYKLTRIALTKTADGNNDPYPNEKRRLTKGYSSGNTFAILPRVSLDGSNGSNSPIWELMRQRNITVTFYHTRDNNQWLDHNFEYDLQYAAG